MKSFIPAVALSLAMLFSGAALAEDAPLVSVNINQASAAELAEVLQGVGESRAEAIVAYREEHGPFADVDALTAVSGVGPSTINNNRARITLE